MNNNKQEQLFLEDVEQGLIYFKEQLHLHCN